MELRPGLNILKGFFNLILLRNINYGILSKIQLKLFGFIILKLL